MATIADDEDEHAGQQRREPVRVATAGASQTPTMTASATPGTSRGVLPISSRIVPTTATGAKEAQAARAR
jgi:hypothetical protein